MSERGSFVTEYIYCARCAEAAESVLGGDEKYLAGFRIPAWRNCSQPEDLPIIAGKIGGLYPGEELVVFEEELMPKLASKICHPLRVAVLADEGQRIFTVKPLSQQYHNSPKP